MVFFVVDTHHANNILTDSPEHGDHHGTLGMHRACIKHASTDELDHGVAHARGGAPSR
jgi:hypothetical protein